ncbi:transglycosylase SLT domain-containing protein [Leisingera caerulea]|uniref:Transglycosylase SLT domain-containing protein n=1 Tax=Leisingera caerulea TaxID=506591 RepID=A0A9Q9HIY6_LEICA|nr:transglycosylase SLT domain-containing protein [Leisingera caerulea]UWQ55993.1 transglycosylase SLT domain-containing protein [Leisingera caerulea]
MAAQWPSEITLHTPERDPDPAPTGKENPMCSNALTPTALIAMLLSGCSGISFDNGSISGQVAIGADGVQADIGVSADIRGKLGGARIEISGSSASGAAKTASGHPQTADPKQPTLSPGIQDKAAGEFGGTPAVALSIKASRQLTAEQSRNLAWVAEAAAEHGIDAKILATIGWLESRLRNIRSTKSSAAGPMQFVTKTAKHYGLDDPMDAEANIHAGARLLRDNAAALRRALGREPSPFELYMAHMQGVGGYLKLLQGGSAQASGLVGRREIAYNTTRSADASANDFLEEWRGKFARAEAIFETDRASSATGGASRK